MNNFTAEQWLEMSKLLEVARDVVSSVAGHYQVSDAAKEGCQKLLHELILNALCTSAEMKLRSEVAAEQAEIDAAQQQADLSGVIAITWPPRDALERQVFGVACTPKFYMAVRDRVDADTQEPVTLGSSRWLLDPRMTDFAVVYYTLDAWKLRCDEQNEWDANPVPATFPNP